MRSNIVLLLGLALTNQIVTALPAHHTNGDILALHDKRDPIFGFGKTTEAVVKTCGTGLALAAGVCAPIVSQSTPLKIVGGLGGIGGALLGSHSTAKAWLDRDQEKKDKKEAADLEALRLAALPPAQPVPAGGAGGPPAPNFSRPSGSTGGPPAPASKRAVDDYEDEKLE